MKRYDEAIAAFNRVQALDPTFPKLAANLRIAEQNRNATTSFNASERTPSTIPTQSQVKLTPTPLASTVPTIPKKSPVSVGGVIGIFSILVVARQIVKKW
jgi:hypothetical protein